MNGKQYYEMTQERKNPNLSIGRLNKLQKVADENGVGIDKVTVVINTDWQWNKRRNRTESEKTAKIIGQTNSTRHGHPLEIVWAYVQKEA